MKEAGLYIFDQKLDTIPNVYEPLKLQTQFVCMCICIFSPREAVVSALSNGEPVEAFCQEWFFESCVDTSGQVEMDQMVQARRLGGQ